MRAGRPQEHQLSSRALAATVLAIPLLIIAAIQVGGRFSDPPASVDEDPPDTRRHTRDLDDLEALEAIGYADFDPEEAGDPQASGVTRHDPSRAWRGYNLYCSRTSPEAFLLDMEGNVVHRWHDPDERTGIWEYGLLLDGGDLVQIIKTQGVFRIDRKSNLVWQHPLKAHHDIAQTADGDFWVLDMEIRKYRGLRVNFPGLSRISSRGEPLGRWAAFENLEEIQGFLDPRFLLDATIDEIDPSKFAEASPRRTYDYFHANTVSILPETPLGQRDDRFREGNLMLCFRNVHEVLILDGESMRVLWTWGAGELERPHHPTMLANGHILIFDNGTERKFSRLIELDPVEGEIVWEYVASPPESFFTDQGGSAQRLPNGNTLAVETKSGRAFEITPSGEIVWEWLNPLMQDGHRGSVYRMLRLAPEEVEPLLR